MVKCPNMGNYFAFFHYMKMNQIKVNDKDIESEVLLVPLSELHSSRTLALFTSWYRNEPFYIQQFNCISILYRTSLTLLNLPHNVEILYKFLYRTISYQIISILDTTHFQFEKILKTSQLEKAGLLPVSPILLENVISLSNESSYI